MPKTQTKEAPSSPVDLRKNIILTKLASMLPGELPLLVQPHEVLVALWEGDEKSEGGILYPDQHRDEHIYQGKTGLIVSLGALAFQDDEDHSWPTKPKEGDWVAFRGADGFPCVLGGRNGQHCRLIHESKVRMIVGSPDEVW
jgi:co-chaperonin GroES (HSP10)